MLYPVPLEPRPPNSHVPLTAPQKAYWNVLSKQETRRNSFRNPAASLRFSGSLNIPCLEQSIHDVMTRHESLRTRIAHTDTQLEPTQVIDPPRVFRLPIIDLSTSAYDEREETARRLAKQFLSEAIDLREGPVFDARLLKLSDRDHLLILLLDHIVSDATSYPILTNEIISFLRNDPEHTRKTFPDLKIQFPDYALWYHKTNEMWRREHLGYWHAKLSHFSRLLVPTDNPSHGRPPQTSDILYVPFGKRLTSELREIAQREHFLLPLVILSLYLVIMSNWCERKELLVNLLSHGRHGHLELRNMIGFIAHPVFLRVEITRTDSLRDIVARVTTELHSCLNHDASRVLVTDFTSEYPTEIFFNWLPTNWGLSGTYPSAISQTQGADNELGIRNFPIGKQVEVGWSFAPYFTDTPSGIIVVVYYGADLIFRSTVERFAANLRRLASTFVNNQNAIVGSLDLQI